MTKNPFTLSFGRVPIEYITRDLEENQIYHMFTELPVTDQIYVILGLRGSGKTVAMTNVTKRIEEEKNWIIVKISPMDHILEALYRILVHHPRVHEACLEAQIDISVGGAAYR